MGYEFRMRRHGWQLPLDRLQIVGMVVYSSLVVTFYTFLGLLLGNRIAEITVTSIYSFVAIAVMLLFIRCTAIDPTDKTSSKKMKKKKKVGILKLNYGFILTQLVVRFLRNLERRILKSFIRRKYLDPWKSNVQMEPLLPFPLIIKDDAISPETQEEDISFCTSCDIEVKKNSKHCRACNRCVEGFDHHCRWLNNCVGKRNYTTFILLMIFVLLMLIIEGGTAIAVFVRCFTDKRGIELELKRRLYVELPRPVLPTISVLLVLMTAYGSAAMGQLFFFHLVLIRKGIRTYDYIMAMREENPFDDTDSDSSSSDDDSDFDSPENSKSFASRFVCGKHSTLQNPKRLSIKIEQDPENKKQGFRVSIDPWKLIKLSREKALLAAEKARERLKKPKPDHESLKPLPLETKCGPMMNQDKVNDPDSGSTPFISIAKLPSSSPRRFLSPRRFSGILPSPKQKYRSNFDLKLTDMSRELETYISKQVLCSVIKQEGNDVSPR